MIELFFQNSKTKEFERDNTHTHTHTSVHTCMQMRMQGLIDCLIWSGGRKKKTQLISMPLTLVIQLLKPQELYIPGKEKKWINDRVWAMWMCKEETN